MGLTGRELILNLVCLEPAQRGGQGEGLREMNVTGYGASLDPETGRGQWNEDSDIPPLRLTGIRGWGWGRREGLGDICLGATAESGVTGST